MLGVSEAAEAQGSRESSNPPDLTSRASLTMTERVLTKPKVSKSLYAPSRAGPVNCFGRNLIDQEQLVRVQVELFFLSVRPEV